MTTVFPSNTERRKIWLDNIGYEGLKTLTDSQLGKKHICHTHFEEKYYGYKCGSLKKIAVPTIFPFVTRKLFFSTSHIII